MEYYTLHDSIIIPLGGKLVLVKYKGDWDLTRYDMNYLEDIAESFEGKNINKINYIDQHVILQAIMIWRIVD